MADDEILQPPGFRFYPTEEELISFYLHQKLQGGRQDIDRVIPSVYIYDYNPWDLPKLSGEECRSDPQLQEWFFFIPKQEREVNGGRPNRLTTTGYWKATGSPGYIYSSFDNKPIGVKRTMVFYRGRARSRSGTKTEWKMNEYMPVEDHPSSLTNPAPSLNGDFTVCRVYIKSKCLRAFDRRPAPQPINRPSLLGHHHEVDLGQPSSSNQHHLNQAQQPPRVEIRRCRSSESFSSLEDNQVINNNNDPNQAANDEQDNNLDMEIEPQGPLWEWDDSWINWYMI
ncbi:NAC domain-containing protein 90 [Beta vulgaris subsp. vulgaris]|uniref:NAC domain-containing protein 90 n=1 Tax=Beta vulgaris subsp. vulgaris TaxID=3555 RepID=UPI002036F962|nr:NAC domain-containing protein 90 [Beta vulgaris subsp. vulgaris]